MAEYFLTQFPTPGDLPAAGSMENYPLLEPDGHVHTPYSFSAFDDLDQLFRKAVYEGINVLGINDFYVTDGFRPFHDLSLEYNIFPLFNIEFIGLLRDEMAKGIRINDPNNPGRIYFCGKGLDYPFHLSKRNQSILNSVKQETQRQLRQMIIKVNELIETAGFEFSLDFDTVRKRYAKELVRERHIAKALRMLAMENLESDSERIAFLESLYGGKKVKVSLTEAAQLENEIRSNILKAGGTAFVAEDESSFLPLLAIIDIINDAGGIPCYPVLLDDPTGKFNEFESDFERLYSSLSSFGVGCVELIPGRNAVGILRDFVEFFDRKNFIITFGTEHNTPEMTPLKITARGGMQLDEKLKQINRKGVCVIAAHQYMRAQMRRGYQGGDTKPLANLIKDFESVGRDVICHYLTRGKNEKGNL